MDKSRETFTQRSAAAKTTIGNFRLYLCKRDQDLFCFKKHPDRLDHDYQILLDLPDGCDNPK